MKKIWPKKIDFKIDLPQLIYKTSVAMCVGSFLIVIALLYVYWNEKKQSVEIAKETAKQEAIRAAEKIDKDLRRLQESAQAIADDLSSNKLKDDQIIDRLKSTMTQNSDFFGVGAAYVPYTYNPKIRLYIPNYVKKQGKLELILEPSYDYTQPQHDWYNLPLTKGPQWQEPFYGQAAGVVLVEYGTPFYRTDPKTQQKKPAGIIYADYSLAEIKSMMASLNLGKTGYGYILSKKGVYISHPIEEYVKSGKNVFELARERNNEQIRLVGEKATKGESGVVEIFDKVTGQTAWVFYQPIPSTGWSMGSVFFANEVLNSRDSERRKLLAIDLAVVSFLFFLSVLLLNAHTGQVKRLWALVYSLNVWCIAGIGFIWYIAITDRFYENSTDERVVLSSPAGLNQFLNNREELARQSNIEKPIHIETGVFVQSLEFNTANNVTMTGYIWQKFYKGENDSVSPGFIMPEAVSFKATEAYRYPLKNGELIGWFFEAKIRQNFDYSRYPLDYKDVWIRLWPKDFNKNVILVPDLESYEQNSPNSLPGIEKDFVLSGWTLESSYFEYFLNSYNTKFGIENYVNKKDYTELCFTVIMRRNLLPIFISNLLPLSVVSFMLYGLLMLVKPKSGSSFIGLSAKDFVTAGSGFIFIALLNQNNLRAAVSATGIIYIEYFYFVFYILILLVIIDVLLIAWNVKHPLIEYQENLLPKLLYWPTILGLLLLITVGIFY